MKRTSRTSICISNCPHTLSHDIQGPDWVQYRWRHEGPSLLRCFLFSSKLKAGDITTIGQYINYQTFSKMQFRPLLKNSFHSIHIDLRDTSGEKIPFVSVGISPLDLMFRKASNIHFYPKRRSKIVASRQVEISFYRGIGRQRGRGFDALAQVTGRTAIPFLRRYFVPDAKRVVVDLLEFAAPAIAEVVSGRRNFKTSVNNMGRQTLRNTLGSGSRKKDCKQIHSNKICKTNQSVARRQFYKHFSLIMSSTVRYQSFEAVSGSLGGKVPVVDDVLSSHEQEIHPTEFEFQTDRNFYVDLRQTYLALKQELVRGRG